MNSKLFLAFAAFTVAAVFVAITFNVNLDAKNSDLSDIAIANVEALASSENGQCSCYGPKGPIYQKERVYCFCENGNCCKDNYGCD